MDFCRYQCVPFLGAKSNEHYSKVEKYFAKKEDKLSEARMSGKGRSRGSYRSHPYRSRSPGASSGSSSASRSLEGPSSSQGSYRSPLDKSKLRCHKCQEFGHFIKDCPNTLGPK